MGEFDCEQCGGDGFIERQVTPERTRIEDCRRCDGRGY